MFSNQLSIGYSFSDATAIREGNKVHLSGKAYVDGLLVQISDEIGGLLEDVQDIALQHGLFTAHQEAHSHRVQRLGIRLSQNVGDQSEKVENDLRYLIRDDFCITMYIVSSIHKTITE